MKTPGFESVPAKQSRTAAQAKDCPDMAFTTPHRRIDIEWMPEAWHDVRKDGAAGVDGVTAEDCGKDLEASLPDLMGRIRSGSHSAPPVRRHFIPKGDGTERPPGIPTLEDKVAQRAVLMLPEPICEGDFLPCPYGFRPGRPAHDALSALRAGLAKEGLAWMIDADIPKCFDSIDHGRLRGFPDLRINDGVIRRMIDRWLAAGVLDKGVLRRPEAGTPQGGGGQPGSFRHLPAPRAGQVDGGRGRPAHRGVPAGPVCRRLRHCLQKPPGRRARARRPWPEAREIRSGAARGKDPLSGLPAQARHGARRTEPV